MSALSHQPLFPGPVVLRAEPVTFTPAMASGTSLSPTHGLWNTESVGVLINRISFNISEKDLAAVLPTALTVKLDYHNEPITNGYQPLAAISYPENRRFELHTSVIRLSRPFYLKPGEWIDVTIKNDILGHSNTVVVNPVASGIQANEPDVRWIPYLTSFRGTVQITTGGAVTGTSVPPDLGNPFATTLYVERLIARILNGSVAAGPLTDLLFNLRSWGNVISARLTDHHDNFWISRFVPFASIVNTNDSSWIVNTDIESKGFLRAELDGTANLFGETSFILPVLGLMGYRQI